MSFTTYLKSFAVFSLCAIGLHAAVPEGWFFAGSKPQEYDCSVDLTTPYNGLPSTYIKSKLGITTTGFGSMMQEFSSGPYAGKRIRMSAFVKTEGVSHWAGLWMRVDDANHPRNGYPSSLAFDNMHDGIKDRSIKGTSGWQNYSVVLDVPQEATGIYIGVLLDGPGALWIAGTKVEVVGTEVPITGRLVNRVLPDGPVNLSFEK